MAQLSRGRRLMGEINVVPYIDVMLVLLIIFMVTAPLLTQGIKVDLPKAAAEPLPPEARSRWCCPSTSRASCISTWAARRTRALEEDIVGARVAAALRQEPERPVLVKADERIPYGRVVEAW